jgi:hypothetical protein
MVSRASRGACSEPTGVPALHYSRQPRCWSHAHGRQVYLPCWGTSWATPLHSITSRVSSRSDTSVPATSTTCIRLSWHLATERPRCSYVRALSPAHGPRLLWPARHSRYRFKFRYRFHFSYFASRATVLLRSDHMEDDGKDRMIVVRCEEERW